MKERKKETPNDIKEKKSLEEMYLEKVRKPAKKSETNSIKSIEKNPIVTSFVQAKKSVEVKAAPVRGTVVRTSKEKQKAFTITMLSLTIIIVLFLSGMIMFANLSMTNNGIFASETGAMWYSGGRQLKNISLNENFQNGCTVTVNSPNYIQIKKTTSENISITITVKAKVSDKYLDDSNILMRDVGKGFTQLGTTNAFTYTWETDSPETVTFCSGFSVFTKTGAINNKNFVIEMNITIND